MAMALYSSTVIFPIASSSDWSLCIPPSIWGFLSSGFIGNITFVPINHPMSIIMTVSGKQATNHSLYPIPEPYAPINSEMARRCAPEPVRKPVAPTLIWKRFCRTRLRPKLLRLPSEAP